MAEINNTKIKAKDFFAVKVQQCDFCDCCSPYLNHLKNEHNTILCDECMELTLEELGLVVDCFSGTNKRSKL